MAFIIIYLPTAEIVDCSEVIRPSHWFNTESRTRAFMEGNICVLETYNKPYIHFINGNWRHLTANEVPLHLLEVIEVI